MQETILDDFEDPSKWTPFSSGKAKVRIARDQGLRGGAMRLDYDFNGGGGFVVARRAFFIIIPEAYSFRLHIRGEAPSNIFEFKLIDSSNRNVWRYRIEDFLFPVHWAPLLIDGKEIAFAWGPLGGGPPRNIEAIEIVIAAGSGGCGSVWFDDLVMRDNTYRRIPEVTASSTMAGLSPQCVLDLTDGRSWISEHSDKQQWLMLDFKEDREYGGIVIHWEKNLEAQSFKLAISSDSLEWKTLFESRHRPDEKTYLYLPETVSRYIRLELERSSEGRGLGIAAIRIMPHDFSRTINHFFHHVAADKRPGLYPKYLLGRQTYWTTVGTGYGDGTALFNEEGVIEASKGSFSIVPFLYVSNRLITWADAIIDQDIKDGYLPIPLARWKTEGITMEIEAFAGYHERRTFVLIRYRIANMNSEPREISLFACIMPFQVTPTWQQWRSFGGATEVREILCKDKRVFVNGYEVLKAISPHDGFGASVFEEGGITRHIKSGGLPESSHISDKFGYASGALRFNLELTPGSSRDVFIALPFNHLEKNNDERTLKEDMNHEPSASELYYEALRHWMNILDRISFLVPHCQEAYVKAMKTSAAYIMINRSGPALHPGPRRYSRAWIRDGVVMGTALLRIGLSEPIKEFLRWYSSFQAHDGQLPDCADEDGIEWLPEFDAYGQFLHGITEYFRFTKDVDFVSEMWHATEKTLTYLEGLRKRRLTDEFLQSEKRALYGILPESMSHEGYMANPVHSYWDDFWALRGMRDAAFLAAALGKKDESSRILDVAEALRKDLKASLEKTISDRGIDYIPGSAELGDFDPAASSIGITLLDGLDVLPVKAVRQTFDIYFDGFRKRSANAIQRENYSAYEIRIIGALIMLGKREEAHELTKFMLKDRRIPAWNQWPEISWKDPKAPAFIGDLPHCWISAEYINSVRIMFAYERCSDDSLVLAAGVPSEWIKNGAEAGVKGLPTCYGELSYTINEKEPGTIQILIQGNLTPPAGGIIIKPPLSREINKAWINGKPETEFTHDSVRCGVCPAEILLNC
ncbi:MAG: hypothetical protein C4582_04910 [Desulfobacteraceae bacterium]|nr:MAG: hypothetical protein C4582_04910 [Desulfobacteraceae bacterium]